MRKQVKCRNVLIGGDAPISIQSMTNVDSRNQQALIKQIRQLEEAGCDIVRIAIPDMESANTLREIRKQTDMPLVADIHFDYRLAIAAIEAGADKVRINPGNIGDIERVKAVVEAAKLRNIPIRVGVNSGSLEKDIIEKNGGVTATGLVESAIRNIRLIQDLDYDQLVVSIKSSSVKMNYDAHKLLEAKTDCPIHIGITEAGTMKKGKVKSAIGIGALLLEGIGDTMRVSLTADPVEEVLFAKEILECVGLRKGGVDIVSCPTCGRTKIDLQKLADQVQTEIDKLQIKENLKIAVMGCAVNGPGEAKEADFGVAGGDGKGLIFAKGKVIKTVDEKDIVKELIKVIEGK
ncbi:MAG: flavodoxin-dependent (E)-4-hydroxy-3-methylbut-2-enyl-diphosphate synthase [Anaerovoracaceae bacterium]